MLRDTDCLESCIQDLQLLDDDFKGSRFFLTRFVVPVMLIYSVYCTHQKPVTC